MPLILRFLTVGHRGAATPLVTTNVHKGFTTEVEGPRFGTHELATKLHEDTKGESSLVLERPTHCQYSSFPAGSPVLRELCTVS